MKRQHLAYGVAACLATSAGFATSPGFSEDTTATKVAAANTTAAMTQATTGTAAQTGDDAGGTSMSALMARNFSEEKLQARWNTEEKLYRDAGIPEEKIKKLHELNVATWKAMASGEKTDYQAYIRERNALLTQEEMQKLRTTQREAIAKRVGQRDDSTSGPGM